MLDQLDRIRLALAVAVLASAPAAAQKTIEAPPVLLFDRDTLASNRQKLKEGDAGIGAAVAALRKEADRALAMRPPSVMDKPKTAASGDRHDYFSYGPYWWPDPTKPGGLPYIRRDGETNPESKTGTDDHAFDDLTEAVETLGLAFWFTGDDRYARKAALLTRVWFLDPATRMNPNFQHAQAIPGVSPGRGIGLIESRQLMRVNEGLALLGGSPAWSAIDRTSYRAWLEKFYEWITTSPNGRDEAKAENNHGTWYDAQVAHLALRLNRNEDARKLLNGGIGRRLVAGIEPDGSQPKELARTRSLSYSLFNLEALFTCARLGAHVGIDWWSYKSRDGRSLYQAVSYVAPYLDAAKAWPKKDVDDVDRLRILPLVIEYVQHDDVPALHSLIPQYLAKADPGARWRLLYTLP